jgi:hypothetical protein
MLSGQMVSDDVFPLPLCPLCWVWAGSTSDHWPAHTHGYTKAEAKRGIDSLAAGGGDNVWWRGRHVLLSGICL